LKVLQQRGTKFVLSDSAQAGQLPCRMQAYPISGPYFLGVKSSVSTRNAH